MREIRVFVSSPADALPERMRLERVIERLNGELGEAAALQAVRWEKSFYSAHATFQAQIPEAAACDIVFGILRHRLGTELPPDFPRMGNGDPYPSGTAYEILSAIEARRNKPFPEIYVFRSSEPPLVPLDDTGRHAEFETQWRRLKDFFDTWFIAPGGQYKAAFHTFSSTDDFETQAEALLRQWIDEHVVKNRAVAWPIEVKGSPFRGLDSFGPRHSAMFFGRSREISRAVEMLKDAAGRGAPFLLVIGPSGAGKSSLARAGILPRLTAPGAAPSIDCWRVAAMRPSERRGDPFLALAEQLMKSAQALETEDAGRLPALPEIAVHGYATTDEFADLLVQADATSVDPILDALDRIAEAERASYGYERPVASALLLLIDQLDEIFADVISEDVRSRFARLLAALAATRRVWIVATLRGDLYERYCAVPELLALKQAGATFDLAPPGEAGLAEIVREPARAAGLIFEADANGRTLDERLLADAGRADMLPLLQFTLDQLFLERTSVDGEERLTHAAYDMLGGLSGAVDRQAERAIAGIGEDALARLPRLLRELATPATVTGEERGRGPAGLTGRSIPLTQAEHDEPAARLVRALVDARILLTSGGEEQETSIRVAHHRVFESWSRARHFIGENNAFLRIRDDVETMRRRNVGLIPQGALLAEAESIAVRFRDELSPETLAYIAHSGNRVRRRQRLVAAAAIVFFCVALAAGYFGWLSQERAAAERLAREESQRHFDVAKATVDDTIVSIAEGLRGASGMPTGRMRDILSDLAESVDRLTQSAPEDAGLQKSRFTMLLEFGDTYREAGESELALESYKEALAVASALARPAPQNVALRHDIARALEKLGAAQHRLGQNDAALATLSDALGQAKALFAETADKDVGHLVALALNEIGDLKRRAGDYAAAVAAYAKGLEVMRRLVAAAPDNVEWRKELAQNLIHIGDARALSDDMPGALAAHEEALAILRDMSAADPENALSRRDLAISLTSLADLELGEGDLVAAGDRYEEAYAIRRHLVALDPGNVIWRNELAIALERLGDIRSRETDFGAALKSYAEAVETRRALVDWDPQNAELRFSLARALQNVGDAGRNLDNRSEALAAFNESVSILRGVIDEDLENTRWLRRFAILLGRLGDESQAAGDFAAASKTLDEALETRRRLVALAPHNVDWKIELVDALDHAAQLSDGTRRMDLINEALALLEELERDGALPDSNKDRGERLRAMLGAE